MNLRCTFFATYSKIVINVFNSEPQSMNIKAACNKLRNHCIFPVYIANPILDPDSVKVSHRLRRNINSVEYQNGISGIIFFLWTVQLILHRYQRYLIFFYVLGASSPSRNVRYCPHFIISFPSKRENVRDYNIKIILSGVGLS